MGYYSIGDICDLNKQSISKKDNFTEILYLDTSSITKGKIDCFVKMDITEAPSRAKRKVQNNTIVYSSVRPNLCHYGVMCGPEPNMIVSTGFITIDIKKEFLGLIDPYFLYLLITQDSVTDYLHTIAENSVSAYPSISPSDIAKLKFNIPTIVEQQKITDFIIAVDRKISLSRYSNETIEKMAKQLYDYWFVQFDFPDENGKPYKSSGGKMVYNETLKREIPEGWEVKNLDHFLEIKNGRDHKHLNDGDYPVYGSGGLMRNVDDYIYQGESILIPRKGSLNNIMYVNESFWTVDTMFYSIVKVPQSAKYTYYTIRDIDFTKLNSGTGVPSMTQSTLYLIKIVLPTQDLLERYDRAVETCFEIIKSNTHESLRLTSLRDFLLPMLMNGQVTIKDEQS